MSLTHILFIHDGTEIDTKITQRDFNKEEIIKYINNFKIQVQDITLTKKFILRITISKDIHYLPFMVAGHSDNNSTINRVQIVVGSTVETIPTFSPIRSNTVLPRIMDLMIKHLLDYNF